MVVVPKLMPVVSAALPSPITDCTGPAGATSICGTVVRSNTGATSMAGRSVCSACTIVAGSRWLAADALPARPMPRVSADTASAERTARVMGANLMMRRLRALLDLLTLRMPMSPPVEYSKIGTRYRGPGLALRG